MITEKKLVVSISLLLIIFLIVPAIIKEKIGEILFLVLIILFLLKAKKN